MNYLREKNSLKYLSNITLIVLLLLATTRLYAQNYELEKLSTKNGLPNNAVRDIFKDKDGIMWLGTDAGLCKYNGKDIEIYTTKDGLAGNKVWGIAEDQQGILWLGTYGHGITYYDGDRFQNLELSDTINKKIRTLEYSQKYDYLFFGTDRGLIVKTDKDSILYFNGESLGIERFQVIAIHEAGEQFFIYTYYNQLTYIFNPKDNTLKKFGKYFDRDLANIASGIINHKGDTIIGYHRNYTAILKHDSMITFENTGQVFDMCKAENNEVWLAGWDVSLNGSNGGLFKIQGDSLEDYTDKYRIPTRAIWSLYYDTLENTLFVGTDGRGLFIYKNKNFEYFDLANGDIEINYLKWIDNTLWIAENKKLFLFDHSNIKSYDRDFFKRTCEDNQNTEMQKYYKSNDGILSATYIDTDTHGNVFVASQRGFLKYNVRNKFECFGHNHFPFVFNKSALYIVGWSNMFECSNISDVSDIFDLRDLKKHEFSEEKTPINISKIVKQDKNIWFLSWSQGLFLFKDDVFYWLNENTADLDNHIIDIAFDKNNNIYIAQNNGELLVAQYSNDSLIVKHKLSCGSGIKGNVLKWLACNQHNQLFLGTDYGLNYINLNQNTDKDWNFRYYNKKEGYSAFESTTAVEDSVGNIWINTHTGLLKINAKGFDHSNYNQDVKITGLDLFNNSADALLQVKNPNFAYDENYFTFHFQRNNFINADKDIYYYRLNGFSEKWKTTSSNTIDYFNLNHGAYRFDIKCFNTNSGKYSNVATYQFTINKAWWTTLWFYSILMLIIGFAIWFYIKLSIRKITKEAEKTSEITKKIAEMEMQALQSQMNPHFVFNSINSIQNFVLDGNIDDTLTYLAHFSTLLRGTLNYASQKYISIEQEQDFLEHYLALEQMRFDTDQGPAFEVEFIIDESLDIDSKIIPPMLLQPVIENSIKHGEIHKAINGKVIIEIKIDHGFLLCSVTDNGIGRAKANTKKNKHHHSKGMSIIQDRIHLLSGNSTTGHSNTGMQILDLTQGTRVELRMGLN